MGARWIEFDVMLSADGEAFVFHDETLHRTTDGKGELGTVSAEYIASLNAGSWFSHDYREEKVPTFRETLAWFACREIQANIEIKPFSGRTQETTLAVLNHLNLYWPRAKKQPLVSSFDVEAIRLCRSLIPELPLGLLFDKWRDDALLLLNELTCCVAMLSKRITTPERVRLLKNQGIAVFVYTVNRRREALRYLRWGVDAVFSNYPLLLSEHWFTMLLKKILD